MFNGPQQLCLLVIGVLLNGKVPLYIADAAEIFIELCHLRTVVPLAQYGPFSAVIASRRRDSIFHKSASLFHILLTRTIRPIRPIFYCFKGKLVDILMVSTFSLVGIVKCSTVECQRSMLYLLRYVKSVIDVNLLLNIVHAYTYDLWCNIYIIFANLTKSLTIGSYYRAIHKRHFEMLAHYKNSSK